MKENDILTYQASESVFPVSMDDAYDNTTGSVQTNVLPPMKP